MFLHNLLNVLVHIANKMGLKKNPTETETCILCFLTVLDVTAELQVSHAQTHSNQ
jgi:hypothetical protein